MYAAADPELRIRGSGLQKTLFRPLGPKFGLKIRGGPLFVIIADSLAGSILMHLSAGQVFLLFSHYTG